MTRKLNPQRRRLVLRVIAEHYYRHGYDDRNTDLDWDDARRRASLLCRVDLNDAFWERAVNQYHYLERVKAEDPALMPDQRTDLSPSKSTLLDIAEDLLECAINDLLPFEQDWATGVAA